MGVGNEGSNSNGGGSSHDLFYEVAAKAAEFFIGRSLVSSSSSLSLSLSRSSNPSSSSSSGYRQPKDADIITATANAVITGTRINNSSSNNNSNHNSNNNSSSSSRIDTGLDYLQQLLGFEDENDLDDSGHTDNDNDDDGKDDDDDDEEDIDDSGDHAVSLPSLIRQHHNTTTPFSFDVSELMPWAHQLDLIVALPLARDRYCYLVQSTHIQHTDRSIISL